MPPIYSESSADNDDDVDDDDDEDGDTQAMSSIYSESSAKSFLLTTAIPILRIPSPIIQNIFTTLFYHYHYHLNICYYFDCSGPAYAVVAGSIIPHYCIMSQVFQPTSLKNAFIPHFYTSLLHLSQDSQPT